ncbi:MAG TPA: phosphate ABC transporter substrate-binding protein PstS [Acidobacteriaceae bacterium]|nr:phosphate ABC transporter substrate-binding protein PstS [Acidobacteriaceae bacterium]
MGNRFRRLVCQARNAAAITAGLTIISFAVAQTAPVSISETGSTLIFPLFQTWVVAYAKVDPNLHMTVGATGSGAGIAQAIAHRVQIGTSDAYMSDDQKMAHPDILNIPLAISAQTVEANLPELHGATLKLSGPVLADIYTGKIRSWDAAPIAALNSGVQLPHHAIIPIHRADGSGDTFIFTQFLSFTTCASGDTDDPTCHGTWADTIGYDTAVHWPSVSGAISASGNQGMLQTLARTPYSVGYLGGSFQDQAKQAGLVTAMLKNQAGKFLLPTQNTVTAAAANLTPRTPPDERLTLVFAPGADSYPLINYEYAVVSQKQANPQIASAISNFLLWCVSPQGGSAASMLDPVHFIPLPTAIRARSEIQIAKIQ